MGFLRRRKKSDRDGYGESERAPDGEGV